MNNNKSAFIVCDEADAEAMPLYKELSGENIGLYVKKAPYSGKCGGFALMRSNSSGYGYTYGTAGLSPSDAEKELEHDPGRLVLDRDGETVIGYAYEGKYSSSSNGSGERYNTDIFLPLGGDSVKTDYSYYYAVFPTDGTSSEGRSVYYTRFVRK